MNVLRILSRRLVGGAAIACFATACSPGTAPAPADPPADATYTVRAEIVRLPAAPGGELYLRHESIPDFRNAKGAEVGMMSMTMPFSAPTALDLAGLATGDRVAATFEVRWSAPKMPLRVTRLEQLPAGTVLEFDEPAEPEPQAAGETPR